MRAPKIKIPKIDLASFAAESLSMDHYWDDLVCAGDASYKKQKKLNKKA